MLLVQATTLQLQQVATAIWHLRILRSSCISRVIRSRHQQQHPRVAHRDPAARPWEATKIVLVLLELRWRIRTRRRCAAAAARPAVAVAAAADDAVHTANPNRVPPRAVIRRTGPFGMHHRRHHRLRQVMSILRRRHHQPKMAATNSRRATNCANSRRACPPNSPTNH